MTPKNLSQDRLKKLLSYDPQTGLFTRLARPGKRSDLVGTIAGSPSNQGYILINVDNQKYRAHRLAWFYVTGRWPSALLDHRNRLKDDNRWDNLREATKAQNEQSKAPSSINTSGTKGVAWSRATKKWQAYIDHPGIARHIGVFESFKDAVAARRSKEQQIFGDYAYRDEVQA